MSGGRPDVGWWVDSIKAGLEYRKRSAMEERWNIWRSYTRGNWASGVLPVNLFFTMMRTIVPRVYFRDPGVSIVSTKPGPLFMGFAKLLERVDSKLIRQMRLKQAMKAIVQDAFLMGTGIGTIGFGAVHEYEHAGHVEAPLVGAEQHSIEYYDHVSANMPWFRRIHPRNYVIEPFVPDFSSSRWTATFVERALADVKIDPRLSKKARSEVQAGSFLDTMSPTGRYGNSQFSRGGMYGNRTEMVQLAVIRDKKTRQVIVMAPTTASDGGMVLYHGHDALQGSGFPEFPLVFNPDSECFWGVPDSQILEPYQLEINEIRTQYMKHRRLTLVKLLARKGHIDASEVAKMQDESVASVVWTSGDPASSVYPMQPADIPQSLFASGNQVLQDVRESVGFSRNQMGEYNSRTVKTTATEAQIVQQASEIRVDERRDAVADLLVDVIEGMHHVIFQQWTKKEVVEVIGPGGVPVWVHFAPSMLKIGQYSVKVDPDSSIPETRVRREQKAMQVFQFLQANPLIDPHKLTQYLLHELHGTAFDDIMKALPAVPGHQETDALGYGDMIRQSIGQANGQEMVNRLAQGGVGPGSGLGSGADNANVPVQV